MKEGFKQETNIIDNNSLRAETTTSIRGIKNNKPYFHTWYRIDKGNPPYPYSEAVSDGKPTPAGAYDIQSFNEGDQVGATPGYVHTHNETKTIAVLGGVPVKNS